MQRMPALQRQSKPWRSYKGFSEVLVVFKQQIQHGIESAGGDALYRPHIEDFACFAAELINQLFAVFAPKAFM